MILAISIVGAMAVLAFVISIIRGASSGRWWSDPPARRWLGLAAIGGIICGILGALLPFV